jgi:large subunit ribosomal protein L21
MLTYAIVQIDSKQYKMEPGKEYLVDFQGDEAKKIEVKVLLKSENGKVEVGTPALKDTLTLEILGQKRGKKVRVAKFHAKANYRRANGHREIQSRVMLAA